MSDLIRLQKYLAAGGVASRRAAEKLIEAGKVKVNGKVVKKLGVKIDALHDIIEVDNSVITVPDKKQYYLLNKPKGYLTTVRDPFGRPTVMDLFPQELRKGLFPVGRLDLDTEGLLLVTNDGETAFRLTHPRFKIKKKYIARVKGIPREKDLQQFKKGILLEDGPTSPADAAIISTDKSNALLQITLHEGKKRQIKRMCKTLGYPVLSLKRTAIAFLKLHGLRPGGYRTLTPLEINKLATLLGLKV
ncbi:MAG TPA: rRNA pseudouridine synthase [Firmicutes bacterium]|jgi:23S rRNA pseudouridine2605 synthase|nr:rRNA pseudouridine synthase [Bacillota bacterium]